MSGDIWSVVLLYEICDVGWYYVVYEYYDDGSKIVVGFWMYLMGDCLIFVVLFVMFGVLFNGIVDGFSGKELFKLGFVLFEMVVLLFSSFIFGLVMFGM